MCPDFKVSTEISLSKRKFIFISFVQLRNKQGTRIHEVKNQLIYFIHRKFIVLVYILNSSQSSLIKWKFIKKKLRNEPQQTSQTRRRVYRLFA